jgi:hypothetical protein
MAGRSQKFCGDAVADSEVEPEADPLFKVHVTLPVRDEE